MFEGIAFGLLVVITFILARVSSAQKSDQLSHEFLINRLEDNLLTQPAPGGLINETSWGGYPVGWHYLAKKTATATSNSALYRFLLTYQPQIFVFATLLTCIAFTNLLMFTMSCLQMILSAIIVLTNYFNTDAVNAKNVGFSSRSVGVFLSVIFLQSANPEFPIYASLALCIISAFAAFFVNVFAAQLIVLYSVLSVLIAGSLLPAVAIISSLFLFLIIGGVYARNYALSTLKYIYVYNSQLIFVFGFKTYQNFHIYFFQELLKSARKVDVRRIYFLCTRNPIIIGFYSLIPFIYLSLTGQIATSTFSWLAPLGVIWLATSFGRLRSLGEGHRYLEPIIYISAPHVAKAVEASLLGAAVAVSVYGALNIASNVWAKKKATSIDTYYRSLEIEALKSTLADISDREDVRVGFDTHYLGRFFLLEDYGVAMPFSPEIDYAGFAPGAVYSKYPFFSEKLVIAQISFYSLTHIVCDDTREDLLAASGAIKVRSFGNMRLWDVRPKL